MHRAMIAIALIRIIAAGGPRPEALKEIA